MVDRVITKVYARIVWVGSSTMNDVSVTFDQLTDIGAESPTLIEGFPGFGLVAATAVDQIDNLSIDF